MVSSSAIRTSSPKGPESNKLKQEPTSKDGETPEINEDIDPANEVQGMKLVLIHLAICLCTFLVGLVSVDIERNTRYAKNS